MFAPTSRPAINQSVSPVKMSYSAFLPDPFYWTHMDPEKALVRAGSPGKLQVHPTSPHPPLTHASPSLLMTRAAGLVGPLLLD